MKLPLSLAGLTTSVAATNLYVSSYGGNITSLKLSALPQGGYSFETIATINGSAPQPSWLTRDEFTGAIYEVDEVYAGTNSTIASYKASTDGQLTIINRQSTINGPVHTAVYNEGKALVAAHYGGSALTSWIINSDGSLSPSQTFIFTNDSSARSVPRPHEALVDPTGSFIVVPDLGSDLLRVFSIDSSTSSLTEQSSYPVVNGTGPRHGAFLKTSSGQTFLFIVTELKPTITAYQVTYQATGLSFTPVFTNSTYGPNAVPPPLAGYEGGPFAGELVVSPDGQYLMTSSRADGFFQIANFDPSNSTTIPSDTLQVWAIDQDTGALDFKQLAPAGGIYPRQFSLNKNGTLAAVGLQLDGRVVIIERLCNGTFGDFVAHIDVPGEVSSVIWDE